VSDERVCGKCEGRRGSLSLGPGASIASKRKISCFDKDVTGEIECEQEETDGGAKVVWCLGKDGRRKSLLRGAELEVDCRVVDARKKRRMKGRAVTKTY
jgi:hypothetical protein